jgi:hypothetical protein
MSILVQSVASTRNRANAYVFAENSMVDIFLNVVTVDWIQGCSGKNCFSIPARFDAISGALDSFWEKVELKSVRTKRRIIDDTDHYSTYDMFNQCKSV